MVEKAGRAASLDVERLLSGQSGVVTGPRARTRALIADALDDAVLLARRVPRRLRRDARRDARGTVLVLGLYSSDFEQTMGAAITELRRSRRRVRFALGALDAPASALERETVASELRGRGKFENLDLLLERTGPVQEDWLLVIDDDVELPAEFLDCFLFLAERFDLELAQPAHRRSSHAAWSVFRRERGTVLRSTRMVEIGPVFAFRLPQAAELLPFPPLRMGWGLDLHWGGVAAERGWRAGVADAVAISHRARQVASGYDRGAAVDELRDFLSGHPHIDRRAALEVLERHRSW